MGNIALLLAQLLKLSLHARQLAILDLRGPFKLPLARLLFRLKAQGFHLLLELADARNRPTFLLPARAQAVDLLFQSRQLTLDDRQPLHAVGVGLAFQRGTLDLERCRLALQLVYLGWHRTNLNRQRRCRLIDKINRLVGQEAI